MGPIDINRHGKYPQRRTKENDMPYQAYVERMIDLVDPSANVILNMSYEEAAERVAAGDPEQVGEIDGQFAIVQKQGNIVRMARSIGRPLRYFLAKQVAGPCLVVAERMDQLRQVLVEEGLEDQFHPSYTRMVPAHYLVELSLVGCPDPLTSGESPVHASQNVE